MSSSQSSTNHSNNSNSNNNNNCKTITTTDSYNYEEENADLLDNNNHKTSSLEKNNEEQSQSTITREEDEKHLNSPILFTTPTKNSIQILSSISFNESSNDNNNDCYDEISPLTSPALQIITESTKQQQLKQEEEEQSTESERKVIMDDNNQSLDLPLVQNIQSDIIHPNRETQQEQIIIPPPIETSASNTSTISYKDDDTNEIIEIEVKDVTDYSKSSIAESLSLVDSTDNGNNDGNLLRGWSRDDDNDDDDDDKSNNNHTSNNKKSSNLQELNATIDLDQNDETDDIPEISESLSFLSQSQPASTNQISMNRGEKALKAIKKASVAVTGGALVAVGLPIMVAPTPGGVVVCGSGLALLATEFPAAQRVLDKSRDGLERMVGKEEDDNDNSDEEKEKKGNELITVNSSSSSHGGKRYARLNNNGDDRDCNSHDEDDDITDPDNISLVCETRSITSAGSTRPMTAEQRIEGAITNARKATKRTKRNLKKFVRGTILPLMNKITTEKGATTANDSLSENTSQHNLNSIHSSKSEESFNVKDDPVPIIQQLSNDTFFEASQSCDDFLRGESIQEMTIIPKKKQTPVENKTSTTIASFPLSSPNKEVEEDCFKI